MQSDHPGYLRLGKLAFFCFVVLLVYFFGLSFVQAEEIGRRPAQEEESLSAQEKPMRKWLRAQSAGDHLSSDVLKFFVTQDGRQRFYLLHVPKKYDKAKPLPLILAFHGGGGSSALMANDAPYHLISKSDEKEFLVAFPNGESRIKSGMFATWNAGQCCGYARDQNVDDVGFVKKVLEDIESRYEVDRNRIYAVGMSNGGMFAYRLACDMPQVFKAIASVAGTDNYNHCVDAPPVSILHIHANNDDHVLFEGGRGKKAFADASQVTDFTSVPKTVSKWIDRDRCHPIPKRVLEKDGVYCDVYDGCDKGARVKLCVTEGGGHSWPGGRKPRGAADAPSRAISATDEIWDFFDSV